MVMHELEQNEEYWDSFYKNLKLSVPSQFCTMVAVELPKTTTVIEFGCGNGRDSLYLASQGIKITAMDLSEQAIEGCKNKAAEGNFAHAQFLAGSLADAEDLKLLFDRARTQSSDGKIIGYSRFVMHSIDDNQEKLFMTNLQENMLSGEKIYLEFRTLKDAKLEKTFGNHYRRFVDTDRFVTTMKALDFSLIYRITGQGMARYKNEDPFVSRLILEKN